MEFLILVVVAAVLILAYVSHQQSKKRVAELSEWARRRGLAFTEQKRHGLDDEYPDFSCLQQGSGRYAYNISRGHWNGRGVLAFDYHYETRSTDSKGRTRTHNHYLSVALLNSGLGLRRLDIRPENLFDRVAEFLGFDDIDFESDEFSRAFHVKSDDRRFAYDVIDQRMMEYLLEGPRTPISISGRHLCTSDGRTWSAAEFEQALDLLEGFVERLAPSLVREIQEGA